MSAYPDRVVFIDETSVKTNLTRQRGWSRQGKRLVMDAPFGSWGTQTFIAGLSAGALIAPWVIKGAMNGEAFAAYIEQVLLPELAPGTVVILDNLATHKNAAAVKAMRKAGCWFLFLPPYSPDLNPIEMAFSKLTAHLRRLGARTFTDMFHALSEICDLYSQDECWNYFKATGYVSSVDAPCDARSFLEHFERVIGCGHLSGLCLRLYRCRGPVWRYADQVQIKLAGCDAL